jgi:hypothetical protein
MPLVFVCLACTKVHMKSYCSHFFPRFSRRKIQNLADGLAILVSRFGINGRSEVVLACRMHCSA